MKTPNITNFNIPKLTTDEPAFVIPEIDATVDFTYVVVAVILSIFTVIGTVGNGLVIYVYSKENDLLTSTLFILVLAVTDFLTCLIIIPFAIVMELLGFEIGDHDIACKVYHFLITCNVPFAAMMMAAIAVDRYLCICHTFLHAMSRFRAKLTVLALLLLALGFGTFTALSSGVYESHLVVNGSLLGKATKGTVTHTVLTGYCRINTIIISKAVFDVYHNVYHSVYPISFFLVVIVYSLIVYNVRMRQQQKSAVLFKREISANGNSPSNTHQTEVVYLEERNPDKNEQVSEECEKKTTKIDKNVKANLRLTMMLFVVALVFIVAFLPAFLMVHRLIPNNNVIFYMYFAHNVANPFIYSFMNRHFRHSLKEKLTCK